jgi:glycosyltransferase involved in cell wall biosynthesis
MLAIVIPYYRITFFEATLQSLAKQTDSRFKVYIGDDASPNSPDTLLDQFCEKFDFTYLRYDANLGSVSLVAQWERCLTMTADEEWVMLLGDDDMLDPSCVEKFYSHLENGGAGKYNVIRFASYIIDADGKLMSPLFEHPVIEKSTDFLLRKINGQTRSSLGEYVFRKSVLQQKGFHEFPLAWHSDDLAFLQCADFGNIYSNNQAIIYIRVSSLSISGDETNIDLKRKASYEFYWLLASNYSNHFTKNQKLKIINKIEQYFYRNKSMRLFFNISELHIRQIGVFELLKFVRRTCKN